MLSTTKFPFLMDNRTAFYLPLPKLKKNLKIAYAVLFFQTLLNIWAMYICFIFHLHTIYTFDFFSIWVFFYGHSRITGLQGKGEGISLTPHCHFYTLDRHLDISQAITARSSPLPMASSRTRTGNLWFPSASS